ncbi:hypothetical protein [Gardnerella vaginalis]|uniref:LPXTG-motif protein cell wall anchor domain protein n=1 Tax=Gardnerella vaginalis TaxID=2702 RepID=A0A2K1SV99_GARVA|nr:hypothetical protein [Gardnerella vaginalis]PNS43467.1 hypothetical protein BFS05_02520 [Gardnerella vaginalis]
MFNKKAIAAFAAVVTLASGIAFAVPAVASNDPKVQKNGTEESAKLSPLDTLKKRVNGSRLLKSEIDEILKYVSKNESKVTGHGDDNALVVKHVDDMIVKYRARHLDVIGLHKLANEMRNAKGFNSANEIFYGSKNERNKAQSAYVNGKAALAKKAEDEGLTLIANKIKESNYSSLASLENLLNESEKYAKEDLIKQAKAKNFHFTAKLISKSATFSGARALFNEAQKTITDSAIKVIVDLGTSEEDFLEYLKKVGKTATPSQIELFRKESQKRRAAQEKSYTDAVELAQIANAGMFTATGGEKAAIAKFLAVVNSFGNKTFEKFNTAEANRAGAAAVEFNNKISVNLKNAIKNYKEEKEKLAKLAEDEDLSFIANLIRNSKKSRLVSFENLISEAKKSKNNNSPKNPGAENIPSVPSSPNQSEGSSDSKSAGQSVEKAPAAPAGPDANVTSKTSSKTGLAKSESATKTESATKSAQTKAVVPAAPKTVNDLKPEVKGKITVSNNNVAKAGVSNRVTVHVDDARFNAELKEKGSVKAYAFIYSTPKLLRSVDGSDYVTVKLGSDGVPYFDAKFPDGYSGKHTVVLVDEKGNQLAWTNITVVNNAVKTSVTTAASNVNALPATGSSVVLAVFAVVAFVAAGFTLRKVRR